MFRRVFALTLLLVVGSGLLAADLTLPDKITGQPGAFIQVPATTTGAVVKWYAVDPGLNLFPVDLLKNTKTAVVVAPNAGSYRLLAYTSDASGPSDPAVCTITVVSPTPPVPPTPPTPPTPTDPFTQAVQAAYAKEASPDKAKQVAYLASVYQGAGSLLTQGMTAQVLFQQLSAAIHNPTLGIPAGSLPLVSQVIGNDEAIVFGTDPNKIIDINAAKVAFAKYAVALGGLK